MIKLEISTHSGDVDTVELEEYDAGELADKINNNDNLVILIGDNIYSRIEIKNIKVVES